MQNCVSVKIIMKQANGNRYHLVHCWFHSESIRVDKIHTNSYTQTYSYMVMTKKMPIMRIPMTFRYKNRNKKSIYPVLLRISLKFDKFTRWQQTHTDVLASKADDWWYLQINKFGIEVTLDDMLRSMCASEMLVTAASSITCIIQKQRLFVPRVEWWMYYTLI